MKRRTGKRKKLVTGAPLRMVTVKEAAMMLGCGRHRLSVALKEGQFASVKLGARLMIPMRELRRMAGFWKPRALPADAPDEMPSTFEEF